MLNIYIYVALSIVILSGAAGAVPLEEWNRTYGDTGEDVLSDLRQTMDGGYIAAGSIVDPASGHLDAWLIRTDADGSELWSKQYGRPGNEYATAFQRTPDGGYLLNIWGGSELFKTDANGNGLWNRTIKPAAGYPNYVLQTRDGGYLMVVDANLRATSDDNYEMWLIRTDKNGSKLWSRRFREAGNSCAVQQTQDGGYVFGCTRFSAGIKEIWITKFESDMNLSSLPWGAPVYSPGELRNCTEIPVKYRNDISEWDIKAVLDAASREIKTFDGSRYESFRANLSLTGGSLRLKFE